MSTPEEQFEAEVAKINALSRVEMARMWRFSPSGNPYFDSTNPLSEVFLSRFKELGGWSPSISKEIGWDG